VGRMTTLHTFSASPGLPDNLSSTLSTPDVRPLTSRELGLPTQTMTLDPALTQPDTVPALQYRAQLQHIHRTASGAWSPDPGCQWVDASNQRDLRVWCR
jgi:hypothetical protein